MKETPINRILCDFDGTLSQTKFNPITGEYNMGKPVPGMIEALNAQKDKEVIIFTARPFAEWEHMRDWLHVHNVRYNGIQSKPLADIYIDDRALRPDEFVDKFRPKLSSKSPYEEPPDTGEYGSDGNKF